jgi:DNA-binding NarL/FixJ family response regulator
MTVNRETVLVCDDNPLVANAIKVALDATYSAYVAAKVRIAINMLLLDRKQKRAEDRYTAVIIDLAFEPTVDQDFNEDGFQILEEAIKDPFIEPILFTGTGSEKKVIRAMDLCAFKYIAKNSRRPDPSVAESECGVESKTAETIPDVRQVVRAVEYASNRRSALLKLEKMLTGTPISHHEVLELRQCLLHLRRPMLTTALPRSGT